MRFRRALFVAVVTALVTSDAWAQSVATLDPHVTASAVDGGLLLRWPAMAGAGTFTFRRRDAGAEAFSTVRTGVDAGVTSWFVPEVLRVPAEFHVQFGQGNAWVIAGQDTPFRDDQGLVALVVDAAQASALETPLKEWEDDLRDDGWAVVRVTLAGAEQPPDVKARLLALRMVYGERFRAAFLFGRVPRAFSGFENPDGHGDHFGAWPADPYYAEFDSPWSDVAVGGVGAFANDAGDGKFDQSTLPSALDVAVGRVDFEKLPAFGPDAGIALLARYLAKAHAHRTGLTRLPKRTLVDDSFGYFGGEAFARGAWRDGMAATGGPTEAGDVFTTLEGADGGFLLAYGCGGGTPTSASGVGATSDFVTHAPQVLFLGLFGSYFGDWSFTDNFMRAALAANGQTLETLWFARPYAHLHSLGALETFGDAFVRGINAQRTFAYDSSFSMQGVHQGLLGDPTVRLYYPVRLSGSSAQLEGAAVRVSWPELLGPNVVGANVYRRLAGSTERETRLTAEPTSATSWVDATAPAGALVEYRVVTVERVTTGSGTFWNHSLGQRVRIALPPAVDAGEAGEDAGLADAGSFADAGFAGDAGSVEDAGLGDDAGSLDDAGSGGDDASMASDAGAGDTGPSLPTDHAPIHGGCGCASAALPWPVWLVAAAAWVARRRRQSHG